MSIKRNFFTLNAHLIHDLGLDSLDTVEHNIELKGTFGITIPDVETEGIVTVKQTIEMIKEKKT